MTAATSTETPEERLTRLEARLDSHDRLISALMALGSLNPAGRKIIKWLRATKVTV